MALPVGVMEDPPRLPDRVFSRPAPFPGCARCASLEREWVDATTPRSESYDPSGSSDIVVVMRRHKEAEHGGAA